MTLTAEIIPIMRADRHCAEYGCRKCIARAHWNKRRKWRTRKNAIRCKTGRK
jgi:hypothetical protein